MYGIIEALKLNAKKYMPQKKGSIPWNKNKKGLQIAWNKNKKTGPLSKTHKKNIGLGNIGKTSGEKHYNWKGIKATYRSIHEWIQKQLGTPETCEKCKKTNLKAQQIHWANKSGQYKRILTDWIRLCVKCHKALDKNRKTIKNHYDKNKHRLQNNK